MTLSYQQFARRLTAGAYRGPAVCLLDGPEAFLKEECLGLLWRALGGGATGPEKVDGRRHTLEEVVDRVATASLFGGPRLVVVQPAPWFSGEQTPAGQAGGKDNRGEQLLLRLLHGATGGSLLVFDCARADRRRRLTRELDKAGALVEFNPLRGAALRRWARERLAMRGKRVDEDLLDRLLSAGAGDLHRLDRELEKLIVFMGDEQQVSLPAAERLLAPNIDGHIFDLVDALGRRQASRALLLLSNLCAQQQAPLYILHMIVRHFRLLYRARWLLDEGRGKEIAAVLKVPPFVASKLRDQARSYPPHLLFRALQQLHQVDCQIKTGRRDADLALKLLVVRLTGAGEQANA